MKQYIETPIEIAINIAGAKSVIRLKAGIEITGEPLRVGNGVSFDTKPDKYYQAICKGMPAFLRLVADEIEVDTVETMADLRKAVAAEFGKKINVRTASEQTQCGYFFDLPNGYVLSVQFGPGAQGTYADYHYDLMGQGEDVFLEKMKETTDYTDAMTAEVNASKGGVDHNPMTGDRDDDYLFEPFVHAYEILRILRKLSAL